MHAILVQQIINEALANMLYKMHMFWLFMNYSLLTSTVCLLNHLNNLNSTLCNTYKTQIRAYMLQIHLFLFIPFQM
jgi:hypothetical protein